MLKKNKIIEISYTSLKKCLIKKHITILLLHFSIKIMNLKKFFEKYELKLKLK